MPSVTNSGRPSPWPIREAGPSEYPYLREVERASEELFAQVGIGPFSESEEENHLPDAAKALVSGDPPLGFACVGIVDGSAHLWQLSVLPSAGGQGLGGALLEAACEWARGRGYRDITLTTFRDVPWNRPFYARKGFKVLDRPRGGLQEIREHEKAVGDDDHGPRVAMIRTL